jgi:AcrR family transcriptional regulator
MVLTDSEKHSSHSRTLILQSALQLFSARGYDGTSIDDIRQAAGFKSKASLYTHFKTKEELASALLHDILVERDRAVMLAYTMTDPEPLQKLVAVTKAFITWGVSHRQKYAFCFLRVQQEILIQGKAPSYVEEGSQPSDLLLLNLLQELRREYPVRPIADSALSSMMIGMITRAIIDQAAFGPANQETTVEHILEACFGILFSKPVPIPASI